MAPSRRPLLGALQWPHHPPSRPRRAVTAAVAAGAALATSTLVAVLLPGGQPPLIAVGDLVVSLTPAGTREAAIGVLGTADKPFILVSVAAVTVAVAVLLGLASRHDRIPLYGGGAALLGLGLLASGLSTPSAFPSTAAATLAAAAVAAWTVIRLTRVRVAEAARPSADGPSPDLERPPTSWAEKEISRRQFTVGAVVIAAAAALGQGFATLLGGIGSGTVDALRATVHLPRVAHPLPPPAPGDSFRIPGVTPLVTPNPDFYRIDTAFIPPAVDPGTWRLRIDGMVGHPLTFSFDELMAMPQEEADITLCCVSDPVGGNLISNARWQGVRLDRLLDRAGPTRAADQVVGRSVDGFTAGFPLQLALDGRAALVAVGMNGVPLPIAHGFPARLVVPGLYGYVSATKWLTEIRLTTFAAFGAYWVERGWGPPAPVLTEARIDVPQPGGRLRAGTVTVAGVAWAQHRGIAGVQVQVDAGPWQDAELAGELSIDTWRQWRLRWEATPGAHTLSARAVDGSGAVQTGRIAAPFPDGATGYPTVHVTVT